MHAASWLSPFRVRGHWSWEVIAVYLLVNFIVAANAALHDPMVGYDMDHHIQYAQALSQGRFPTPEESDEFFSPPLPYLLPAVAMSIGKVSFWRAAKYAQWLNVLLSAGLTFILLKIGERAQPQDKNLRLASLALLGMLPVYYKTFAQPRGEPFVAFFAILVAWQVLDLFIFQPQPDSNLWLRATGLGVSLGLLMASRQWGLLVFPALALFAVFVALKSKKLLPLWQLLASFSVAGLMAGWFYVYLWVSFGSLAAFNREPASFSFRNQPDSFYFSLGLEDLFRDPVRPVFANQLWPILYADTWGDYWGYFLITSKDLRSEQRGDGILYLVGEQLENALSAKPPPDWLVTNHFEIGSYLGRVNLVSLLPTILLVAGMLYAIKGSLQFLQRGSSEPVNGMALLFALIGFVSFAGYTWFLIRYPILDKGGNNIKAAYLLHLYPFLALKGGFFLQEWAAGKPFIAWSIGLLLAAIFINNFPALITHYPVWSTHLVNLFSFK